MNGPLSEQVHLPDAAPEAVGESVWVEVIQRMDEIYADLVRYQVDLEDKNAQLEEARRFIDSVLEGMSDVLVVADVQGRIQRVNRALIETSGRNPEALAGRPVTELFTPACRHHVERFPQCIREGGVVECEMELIADGSDPVPLAVSCSPRYDADGVLRGMVLTGRPLGELRQAYAELRRAHAELQATHRQLVQSEKMASLGRLVAGVAHELNNPISFVLGNMHAFGRYSERLRTYLDAVHRGAPPAELEALRRSLRIDRILDDLPALIEGTLEGAERVSEIVENLRRFSTPGPARKEPFDLVRLVRSTVSWVSKSARRKPHVQVKAPDRLPVISHEGYVHQILLNLVQNAVDAMEEQDEPGLEVTVSGDGSAVEVRVRDHGPGIPEPHLVRIFDPFFTTKAVGKGTGLGLYISYGLATEQCGGSLEARNHPRGGAEFVLRLPTTPGGEHG